MSCVCVCTCVCAHALTWPVWRQPRQSSRVLGGDQPAQWAGMTWGVDCFLRVNWGDDEWLSSHLIRAYVHALPGQDGLMVRVLE